MHAVATRDETTLERNKELIRDLIEHIYAGKLDRLDDVVAQSYVDHSRWRDRSGLKKVLEGFLMAYDSVVFTLEDVIAESDRVAARIRCVCRSPGKDVEKSIRATAIFRIADGQVVEHWGHSDSFY